MRIGLVVHGTPPELVGGTERHVAELAAGLSAAGHEVAVFSGSIVWKPVFDVVRTHLEGAPGVPLLRVHRQDLFFERWDKLASPWVEGAYAEWLAEFRPQLVHVHHWVRLTDTLVRRARAVGAATVLSLHDLFSGCPRYHRVKADDSFCEERPAPSVCRHCAPRWRFQSDAEIDASVSWFAAALAREVAAADAVLVPTAGHGRRVLGWLGAAGESTRGAAARAVTDRGARAPEAIALSPPSEVQLAPATRPLGARRATAADPLRVGLFGHLHPLKGIGVALAAQAALPEPGSVELQVWGAAPTPEAEAELRARTSGRRVVWHGAYVPEQLGGAAVDVVVLPTLCAESYSFALDEAAALGVPIVASDLGALRDRATARMRFFPRGDAAALAARLAELGADPVLRARLSSAPAPMRSGLQEHLTALGGIYARVLEAATERATQAGGRGGAAPSAASSAAPSATSTATDQAELERARHLFDLREAALGELLRSEGWEAVVADLKARLGEG